MAWTSTCKAEAAELPLGAEGLLVLPYLAGERTPVFDPDPRGLGRRAHPAAQPRTSVPCGVRGHCVRDPAILDLFEESAPYVTGTLAVGGGVNSPLWTSIVSDVTGRTQLIPRETIGACTAAHCSLQSELDLWIRGPIGR